MRFGAYLDVLGSLCRVFECRLEIVVQVKMVR